MRKKVALVIIAIAFAITAASFGSSLILSNQTLKDTMSQDITLAKDLIDQLVSTKILLLKSDAHILAERLTNVGSRASMEQIMSDQIGNFPEFMALSVVDSGGVAAQFGDSPVSDSVLAGNGEYTARAFTGESVISSPEIHSDTGKLVMQVWAPMDDGRILAATIPGMLFSYLLDNIQIYKTGQVFILNAHGVLIADYHTDVQSETGTHYHEGLIAQSTYFSDISSLSHKMQDGVNFFENILTGEGDQGDFAYDNQEYIFSYSRITASKVKWHLFVSAPLAENPSMSVQNNLIMLAGLFFAASIIIAILISGAVARPYDKISEQNRSLERLKKVAEEQAGKIAGMHRRTTMLMDTTPMSASLWDSGGHILECNEESIKLFKLKNKKEFLERFYEFSPARQPDGTPSADKVKAIFEKAIANGKYVGDWMHQLPDGTPIPCEATIIRIDQSVYGSVGDGGGDSVRLDGVSGSIFNSIQKGFALDKGSDDDSGGTILAVFVRDLREHKWMTAERVRLQSELEAALAEAQDANQRTMLILDATPLVANLFNLNYRPFETNEEAVKLFHVKDKKEYLERFFEFIPEFQPNGERSVDMYRMYYQKAFVEGRCVFEWMRQRLDGTPMPAEVTLVRLKYKGDYVISAYSRDLREHKEMEKQINRRDIQMSTVTRTAAIMLQSDADSFDADIMRCMEMICECVDVDRIRIWKTSKIDGELYGTVACEWNGGIIWQKEGLSAENAPAAANVPYKGRTMWKALSEGNFVNGLVKDMDQNEQDDLSARGILSIFAEPVFARGQYWGFVSFSNCHEERLYPENEQFILRSGAMILANAFLRHEMTIHITDSAAKLEVALKEARQANTAKNAFLANMSHEIRTPLNAVVGLSELILDEDDLNEEFEDKLGKIHASGLTILGIVNDILDISKIESGKFEINPVEYSTPSMINDVVTFNILRIGEKPITFKLFIDKDLPATLFGDDLRIRQIFNNLLSNAFKYTKSGTVEWRVYYECDNDDEGLWLISSVQDSGIGIKPEDMEKLFSEYNQVDVKTNRSVEGTGLGLAITKCLVEMMDGAIRVESEYGKGTRFEIRIRQKIVDNVTIGADVADNLMSSQYIVSKRSKSSKMERIDLSYARVLVVDDVATNLDVVKGMMKPYRLNIDCALSGQQAIDMIRAYPNYSAVFMDHMMPEMDGIEATRIIREGIGTDYAKNIPVVALTANAIAGNEEMFLKAGFQAFLSKPIDTIKLDSILRLWVRDRSLENELVGGMGMAGAAGAVGVAGTAGAAGLAGTVYAAGGVVYEGAAGMAAGGEKPHFGDMDIEGLDVDRGLERFSGDEDVYSDVLRSFISSARSLVASMTEYLSEENLANYAIAVHGIKGASYGICANEAGKAAEVLEVASKSGNLDAVKAGHNPFESILERLLGNIEKSIDLYDGFTEKPTAAEPDRTVIDELREACGAYDMDRVDKAMTQLESFNYEKNGALVAWLREQIDNMTFEAISGGDWLSA